MISRFSTFSGTFALAIALAAFSGCAGSKSASSGNSSGEAAAEVKVSKVDEARHSAEDAEMKAHQLREDKSHSQTKPSAN